MLDRKIAPPMVDAVEYQLNLLPIQKYELDNGIKVFSIDAGAEEVLQIEWYFHAGNWYETKNIEASTVNHLLKCGTKSKNAFQINEHFEYYGSFLKRACYNEYATISLHALSKHVDVLLPVVKELILESTLPQDELALYQQNRKQQLTISEQKADFIAGRLIDSYLFGENHPYGKYTRMADIDALERESLEHFYQQHYQQGQLMLFVAGKLPINFIEKLNQYFGDLPNQYKQEVQHIIVPTEQKKHRIINDEKGVQGAIRMARPFPNRHHPDFKKVMILNTIFGGYFGSRLMSNIREEKGYTYGIYSYLLNQKQQSAWMISTEAGREVSEATVEEVYKEMKALREKPIDEEELSLVRNYMMGTILGDLDGPFQIMGRWKNIILNEVTEDYFYDSIRTIKSVTADELQALANKYLVPEDFYELVVV